MSDAPDPRPRPAYGEYATPEQQRARIRQPDATDALSAGVHPAAASTPPSAPGAPVGPATTTAARPTRTADRIITFVLLGYGLVTVFGAVPQMLDIDAFTRTFLQTLGAEAELSNPGAGAAWGVAAAAVLALGWLMTAWLSWRSVRANRLSWWIPLVGGIVFNIVSASLVLVPILGDPAVWDALQSSIGG